MPAWARSYKELGPHTTSRAARVESIENLILVDIKPLGGTCWVVLFDTRLRRQEKRCMACSHEPVKVHKILLSVEIYGLETGDRIKVRVRADAATIFLQ